MAGTLSPLKLIIHHFADLQKEQIERIYRDDAIFREICHDYAECIRMRDKYAADTTTETAQRFRQDYEALIESLEDEMLAILQESIVASKTQQQE